MPSTEQADGADHSDAPDSSRDPAGPPQENPTSRQAVHEWIAARVAADEQMRFAGAAAKAAANAAQGES